MATAENNSLASTTSCQVSADQNKLDEPTEVGGHESHENEKIVTLKCQYCRAEGKIFQDKNDESLRMTGLKKRDINFVLKFYDLNDNEEFVNGQTDLCKKCKENISIYGMPKNCQTCDIQAAFTESNCERCDFSLEQFGSPKNCERCTKKCAFGKFLECWLCRMSYGSSVKKVKSLPPPIECTKCLKLLPCSMFYSTLQKLCKTCITPTNLPQNCERCGKVLPKQSSASADQKDKNGNPLCRLCWYSFTKFNFIQFKKV